MERTNNCQRNFYSHHIHASPYSSPCPSSYPSLYSSCRKLTAKWPPDLIWLDWFNGRQPEIAPLVKGRPTAVFRYNLLDHIGAVSSFDVRVNRPAFPGCYEEMDTVWSLHDSERFKVLLALFFRLVFWAWVLGLIFLGGLEVLVRFSRLQHLILDWVYWDWV